MKTFCCLILSLVGVLLLAGVSQANDEHVVEIHTIKYVFVNTKLSWIEAYRKCAEKKMDLVNIVMEKELDILSAEIAKLPFQDAPTAFWTDKFHTPANEKEVSKKDFIETVQCMALTSTILVPYPCSTPTPYICEGGYN